MEKQEEYADVPVLHGHTPSLKSILKRLPEDPQNRCSSVSTLVSSVTGSEKSMRPFTANVKGWCNSSIGQ